MTLKEILDDVCRECGIDINTVYATSTDDSVLRLLNLANRSAVRIATGYKWQALRSTYLFSMTTATEYDLPEDFRELVPDTAFNDSNIAGVAMRTPAPIWHYLQTNSGGTGPRYQARILGDKIKVYSPQSGDQITFEYLSKWGVLATDGTTYKQKFTADTDTWRLDDDLLEMDLIWRYKKLLGMEDWQVDYQEFQSYDRTVKGQEAGAQTIIGGEFDELPEPYTPTWV